MYILYKRNTLTGNKIRRTNWTETTDFQKIINNRIQSINPHANVNGYTLNVIREHAERKREKKKRILFLFQTQNSETVKFGCCSRTIDKSTLESITKLRGSIVTFYWNTKNKLLGTRTNLRASSKFKRRKNRSQQILIHGHVRVKKTHTHTTMHC